MISKITYTPQSFSIQNFNNCCGPKKGMTTQNSSDISFEGAKVVNGKALKKIDKNEMALSRIINNIFGKLSQNKGAYLATSEKGVDIFAREVKLGKEATLTLSNGIFDGKSFMSFILKRSAGEKPQILPMDEKISTKEANKYVLTYLDNLK